jgi:hypothetical protein
VSQFLYFSECWYEECHYAEFCIGATYEMRTVLYKIRLFNDELVMQDRVFISKHFMRGESKTAERQKERECVRGNALLKMKDGIGNKIDCWRKYLWQMCEINLRQSRWLLMMVFPQL